MSHPRADAWLHRLLAAVILTLPILLAVAFLPWLDAPFSVPKTAALTLAAVLLFASALVNEEHLPVLPRTLRVTATAFLAIVVVSAALSPYRQLAASGVVWAASGVLLFLSAPVLVGHTQRLFAGIALAGSVVAAITLLQFFWALDLFRWFRFSSSYTGRMRLYATIGNPDFVAVFLAACVPALLVLALKRGVRRWACITGAVASIAAVVVTGSRVGVCATAVALGTTLVLLSTSPVHRVLSLALVVLAALATLFVPALNRRSVEQALRGRVFIWQVSLRDAGDNVLLGDGPSTFAYLYPMRLGRFFQVPEHTELLEFAGNERHAENDYLEMFTETGMLGLAAFVAVLGAWLGSALRARAGRRHTVNAALGAVAALAVAALADFPLHRAETWALFWLWLAIPFTHVRGDAPSSSRPWKTARVALAGVVVVAGVLLAARPLAASYWSGRGRQLEAAAKLDDATVAYERALRWDAAWADARFNLVRVLAKRGRFDESWRASEAALAFVNEPESWLLRARIQQLRGNPALALVEVQRGLRLFPYSPELQAELAGMQPARPTP